MNLTFSILCDYKHFFFPFIMKVFSLVCAVKIILGIPLAFSTTRQVQMYVRLLVLLTEHVFTYLSNNISSRCGHGT